MAVKDYTGPPARLKQFMIFDFSEFYSMLTRIIKDRGFSGYIENFHSEFNNPDGTKTTVFSWGAAKKIEPYIRLCIDFDVKAVTKDTFLESEGKTMAEGTIEFTISSYMMRDVEDEWGFRNSNPTRRFLRDLYDKFLNVDRIGTHVKRLKSDTEAAVADLKAYMKLHKSE